MLKDGKGKPKNRYTRSIIRNQTNGKGELTSCSPKEGRNSGLLKTSFRDLERDGEEADCNKKQRGVSLEDLTVEAGSQHRRQQ